VNHKGEPDVTRGEYLVRAREQARRGEALAWSKLTALDVHLIRQAVAERKRLKREASQLSNGSLARKFGVSKRAIDRVTNNETWAHVA